MYTAVASEAYLVRRGRGCATTCELYCAKIIAELEHLQPALNEIHKFCFQHWSHGRGTCGTGSSAPALGNLYTTQECALHQWVPWSNTPSYTCVGCSNIFGLDHANYITLVLEL